MKMTKILWMSKNGAYIVSDDIRESLIKHADEKPVVIGFQGTLSESGILSTAFINFAARREFDTFAVGPDIIITPEFLAAATDSGISVVRIVDNRKLSGCIVYSKIYGTSKVGYTDANIEWEHITGVTASETDDSIIYCQQSETIPAVHGC